jgi:lysozyme
MIKFSGPVELTAHFEGFRPWAYPDPASPLATATSSMNLPWGFEDATKILSSLKPEISALKGTPWTIGYGTTWIDGNRVPMGMNCTKDWALTMLRRNLLQVKNSIEGGVTLSYPSHMMDAVCDIVYNMGLRNVPNLILNLKRYNIEQASMEFLDGIYSGGVASMGLLLRRISNYNTFMHPEYVAYEKSDSISKDLKKILLAKNQRDDAIKLINKLNVI